MKESVYTFQDLCLYSISSLYRFQQFTMFFSLFLSAFFIYRNELIFVTKCAISFKQCLGYLQIISQLKSSSPKECSVLFSIFFILRVIVFFQPFFFLDNQVAISKRLLGYMGCLLHFFDCEQIRYRIQEVFYARREDQRLQITFYLQVEYLVSILLTMVKEITVIWDLLSYLELDFQTSLQLKVWLDEFYIIKMLLL
eukprot:TRINITY_DN67743_c0_g1_i5.p1 TRINITY_DN67743_c0_g1~~TRINITY_DN67743_c0_g1_i5.p1  ORF type:complete len:229 (-),score=-17.47 TRINITY_DN67743_c0_g1_i5:217-807(-)